MVNSRRRFKRPRPGQAGGLASGKARQRTDNLEIWLAYREAKGKFDAVKALEVRFSLSRRRIRQIGTGPKPTSVPAADTPADGEVAMLAPDQAQPAPNEPDPLLATIALELANLEHQARDIRTGLHHAETGQTAMFSRLPVADDLIRRIVRLKISVNKKIPR